MFAWWVQEIWVSMGQYHHSQWPQRSSLSSTMALTLGMSKWSCQGELNWPICNIASYTMVLHQCTTKNLDLPGEIRVYAAEWWLLVVEGTWGSPVSLGSVLFLAIWSPIFGRVRVKLYEMAIQTSCKSSFSKRLSTSESHDLTKHNWPFVSASKRDKTSDAKSWSFGSWNLKEVKKAGNRYISKHTRTYIWYICIYTWVFS